MTGSEQTYVELSIRVDYSGVDISSINDIKNFENCRII